MPCRRQHFWPASQEHLLLRISVSSTFSDSFAGPALFPQSSHFHGVAPVVTRIVFLGETGWTGAICFVVWGGNLDQPGDPSSPHLGSEPPLGGCHVRTFSPTHPNIQDRHSISSFDLILFCSWHPEQPGRGFPASAVQLLQIVPARNLTFLLNTFEQFFSLP